MSNIIFFVIFLAMTSPLFAGAQKDASPVAAPITAPVAAPMRGSVVYLEGDVEIDGKEAEIGMVLGEKTLVRTGPASSCEIVFAGKNAVRVSQNAVATLDFSKAIVAIDLEKGGVTGVLRKLATVAGDDSFRVRTEGAVAGVRGTSLCVWADSTSTYICACNGSVHTEDSKGNQEFTLEASHHLAKLYAKNGDSISVEAAGMLHHTDESVESLASRIGENIDWSVAD